LVVVVGGCRSPGLCSWLHRRAKQGTDGRPLSSSPGLVVIDGLAAGVRPSVPRAAGRNRRTVGRWMVVQSGWGGR
jgi:hypothetical protein